MGHLEQPFPTGRPPVADWAIRERIQVVKEVFCSFWQRCKSIGCHSFRWNNDWSYRCIEKCIPEHLNGLRMTRKSKRTDEVRYYDDIELECQHGEGDNNMPELKECGTRWNDGELYGSWGSLSFVFPFSVLPSFYGKNRPFWTCNLPLAAVRNFRKEMHIEKGTMR